MLEDSPTPFPGKDFLDSSHDTTPTSPEIMKNIHEELDQLETLVGDLPNGISRIGLLEIDKSELGIHVANADPNKQLMMGVYFPDDHSDDRVLRLIRASINVYPPGDDGYDIIFDVYPDKIGRRHEEHLDFKQATQTDGYDDMERLLNYLRALDGNDESARQLRETLGLDAEGMQVSVGILQFVMHLNDIAKIALK